MHCLEIYFNRTFFTQFTVHYLAFVIFLCLRTSKDLSVGELDRAFLHIILLAFLHHIVIIFSHYLLKKYSNTPIMLHLQHSSIFCRKGRKGPKSFYNGECQVTVVVVIYGGTRLWRKEVTRGVKLKLEGSSCEERREVEGQKGKSGSSGRGSKSLGLSIPKSGLASPSLSFPHPPSPPTAAAAARPAWRRAN